MLTSCCCSCWCLVDVVLLLVWIYILVVVSDLVGQISRFLGLFDIMLLQVVDGDLEVVLLL